MGAPVNTVRVHAGRRAAKVYVPFVVYLALGGAALIAFVALKIRDVEMPPDRPPSSDVADDRMNAFKDDAPPDSPPDATEEARRATERTETSAHPAGEGRGRHRRAAPDITAQARPRPVGGAVRVEDDRCARLFARRRESRCH